jgi:hypothetical protein
MRGHVSSRSISELISGSSPRAVVGAVVVWSAWVTATLVMILFIRQHARNIPYWDDLEALVPVVTGHEPLSFQWLAAQHNEHRAVIPKLIQIALLRAIPDFRAGLYLNAGLLSAAAASAIIMARRVRGWTGVIDIVLPLSILTIGQWECLMISFALNLVITSWISWSIIGVISRSSRLPDWRLCLLVGGFLVLLPLCGGSGIVMVPPLVLWLAGYVACGWWSERDPGPSARAISLGLLMTTSAIGTWYLCGYARPTYIPVAPSMLEIWSTTLQVLSLPISPQEWGYWRIAGLAVLVLTIVTVILLGTVVRRVPQERPRAFGLIALLLSTLGVAVTVGISRSGFGPTAGLCSRYITISLPLLGVLYFAWLLYGPALARRAVHISLLALVCAGMSTHVRGARAGGEARRALYTKVERGLQRGLPASRVVDLAHPELFVDRSVIHSRFQMLKEARVGKFRNMVDDGLAVMQDTSSRVR